MGRYLPAFLFAVLLAGCRSTPVEQMSYAQTKELARTLHQRCAEEGAPMGSKEFDACMHQELSREASLRSERHNRRRSGVVCFNSFGTVICN